MAEPVSRTGRCPGRALAMTNATSTSDEPSRISPSSPVFDDTGCVACFYGHLADEKNTSVFRACL